MTRDEETELLKSYARASEDERRAARATILAIYDEFSLSEMESVEHAALVAKLDELDAIVGELTS